MSLDKNIVLNTIYNAGLITLGPVGTSMISKGIFKLAVAVGGGSVLVKYLQKSGYVPEEPWKE